MFFLDVMQVYFRGEKNTGDSAELSLWPRIVTDLALGSFGPLVYLLANTRGGRIVLRSEVSTVQQST